MIINASDLPDFGIEILLPRSPRNEELACSIVNVHVRYVLPVQREHHDQMLARLSELLAAPQYWEGNAWVGRMMAPSVWRGEAIHKALANQKRAKIPSRPLSIFKTNCR